MNNDSDEDSKDLAAVFINSDSENLNLLRRISELLRYILCKEKPSTISRITRHLKSRIYSTVEYIRSFFIKYKRKKIINVQLLTSYRGSKRIHKKYWKEKEHNYFYSWRGQTKCRCSFQIKWNWQTLHCKKVMILEFEYKRISIFPSKLLTSNILS